MRQKKSAMVLGRIEAQRHAAQNELATRATRQQHHATKGVSCTCASLFLTDSRTSVDLLSADPSIRVVRDSKVLRITPTPTQRSALACGGWVLQSRRKECWLICKHKRALVQDRYGRGSTAHGP